MSDARAVMHATAILIPTQTPRDSTMADTTNRNSFADPELLIPSNDCANPEVTILIPALNEELTISEFVAWCKQGLSAAGVQGEIVIVDSSNDRTAELAVAAGARVIRTPKRGLGRAYIDSIPFVRGTYVLMGDCDLTYDFREIGDFVTSLRSGYQYVMGSRFRGYIEAGSMPWLHQYFGTPGTTWLLNIIYGTRFSDIHCGMRGISLDALKEMHLVSQGWEYASEMVLKSVLMRLPTAEVPIRFLKEPEGRLSHHRRSGWLSPWLAAWVNMRAMFVSGSEFFVLKPGLCLFALGLLLTLPATFGPIELLGLTFSLHWQLAGFAFSGIGLQLFYFGCIGSMISDRFGDRRRLWRKVFGYDRIAMISTALFLAGTALCTPLVLSYWRNGFALPSISTPTHLSVTGLLLVFAAVSSFVTALIVHAIAENTPPGRSER